MSPLELKPTHKPVQNYFAALRQFDDLGVSHEGAVKSAFHGLLEHCARQHDWTLVPEWELRRPRQHPLRVDGALLDNFRLTHGFWEAKDIRDDLPREACKKFDLGYLGRRGEAHPRQEAATGPRTGPAAPLQSTA
jgi:hypothetical protein